MAKKQQEYGNDSIRQLKGADRVRKRPAVIFGSDGVEGCAHSIFEIISNSIDEARDGHGNRINVTLFPDHVVEVEDFGRGIPVDIQHHLDAGIPGQILLHHGPAVGIAAGVPGFL